MPVHQVILLHTMRTFEELRDDYFKWAWTPDADARKFIRQAENTFKISSSREIIPLAGTFVPALMSIRRTVARADRDLVALQILEAIRLFGAAHDRRLPECLAEITAVPVPLDDPLRGEPFLYRRQGETAILESPCPDARPEFTLRYQIRFDREGDKP